ncbi:hypothetical protein ARMSODRAFT_1052827 [Armillaria solidipes]|uniref:NACHT-NTPase and P-loop NTPases N-terminal domain-containing protein n=1 Tax=Armillaria solidipes TaxID=1076256 RepID=A0A2H3B396_9AGAR|nr:hypothetical protein ARMSODRAFT_1052827 [Armillaria solidipes]
MPALNASLQVASLVEASGVPYIEKLAKVAVAVIELLEKKAKNKEDVKELCQSITDTVAVIQSLIGMHREQGAPYFQDICTEMERYLTSIACDLKDVQGKHRGFKGILNVNKFQDTIQGYKKRVDDLKMDFLIHVTGDSMLALIEIHRMLTEMGNAKETASKKGGTVKNQGISSNTQVNEYSSKTQVMS